MVQCLILPINQMDLTVSYKHPWYGERFNGQIHYGIDCVHKYGITNLYGCGDGVVVFRGFDHVLGNTLGIRYDNVQLVDGRILDVIVRYYHLDRICVEVNDKVNINTLVGRYGRTGTQVLGSHLHCEVDYDVLWPTYTPCLKGNSNILKATPHYYPDTTLNPMNVFYMKKSKPECQTVTIKYPLSVEGEQANYQVLKEK